MIPQSSGQPWGPSLRTVNGPGRVENAMLGHDHLDRPMPQPPIRPAVVDLTAGGPESQDREPPPKRPRLDVPGGSNATDTGATMSAEARSAPGSATSRPTVSWRGRPLWSFQAVVSELPNNENRGDGTGSKPPSPPPLPAQPWEIPAVEPPATTVVKSRESSPVGAVQTTPYRIETPSAAPVYKNQSK
jgi:mediator of RNA polymerase II transcription subunit 12